MGRAVALAVFLRNAGGIATGWHLLLFLPPEHRDQVRETMRRYALETDGDEPGAAKHRFKMVAIDK